MFSRFVTFILVTLLASVSAFACPKNCKCDKYGNVVSYNTTNNNNSVNTNNYSSKSNSKANSNAISNSNAKATGGTSVAEQSQQQQLENSGNNTGSASVAVEGDRIAAPRFPVSTAYAPGLVAGEFTCLGSAGAGAQTSPVGLSFGTTRKDDNCILIRQTQLLESLGYHKAACYRMQLGKEGAEIKQAMEQSNTTCDNIVEPPLTVAPVVPADVVTHEELNEKLNRIVRSVTSK
jgi:hypothetical protein